MRRCLIFSLIKAACSSLLPFICIFLLFSPTSFASDLSTILKHNQANSVVTRQIELLDNRIKRAKVELSILQRQQVLARETALPVEVMSQKRLDQAKLDLAVAKSNLDSVNVELTESQQTITRLEKEVQELRNQLNVVNVFGLRIMRNASHSVNRIHSALKNQADILAQEKIRSSRLVELHKDINDTFHLYQDAFSRLENLRKTQATLQLKDRRTKADRDYQSQQNVWFKRLDKLETKLENFQQRSGHKTILDYERLRSDIFYANENVSFIYLQMLVSRYQDEAHQLKVTITADTPITVLNRASVQMHALISQLSLVDKLLDDRLKILSNRQKFAWPNRSIENYYQKMFINLQKQYHLEQGKILDLHKQLASIRVSMDKAMQHEISSRQGLPDFSARTWIDLGGEILLLPSLIFQVMRGFSGAVIDATKHITPWGQALFYMFEVVWIVSAIILNFILARLVKTLADHESGHLNLKWLVVRLLQRMLIELVVFGNIATIFLLSGGVFRNYFWLIKLAIVWLFFRMVYLIARLSLIETAHDRAGADVRLYRHLCWLLGLGGLITGFVVLVRQLPIIYNVQEVSIRLFLFFLFVISFYLLRQWRLVPDLILLHIDKKHTYVRRVIRVLGLLIPLIILINSVVGLFGYINLVRAIFWYEMIFIIVLATYLIVRGILNDLMEFVSRLLIHHVTNGWLWTEAFLKPIDRLLRVALFFSAWLVLFLIYGWNRQEKLHELLNYRLLDFFNTSITPLRLVVLFVIVSFLYWAARWMREFVYRFLLSRTRDLGVRNSLAILSQYAMIVIGFFITLSLLGINLQALTVVATAFSLGVGLGLRDLVNNFVCGFLLLLERPLRIGDTISIGGFEGEVIHIGGRAVTVRNWDHIDVLVPNAEIFSKSFSNWTRKDNIIRTVISIKINRQDDPHKVQKIILDTLDAYESVLQDPAPEVFLKELADGMIEFEVRYFFNLAQVRSRPSLRSEVLLKIWDSFEKHNIKPPYPHQELLLNK